MKDSEKRRVRIVRLDERLIGCLLSWMKNPSGCLALPRMDDVPDDCEIVRVMPEPMYRAIDFLIYHPSFDEVEPCVRPPVIGESMEPPRIFKYTDGEWSET